MIRQPAQPIDTMFTDRWSPRAFDRSALDHATLMTLFEAARWAPSSYNSQPWHYVYALRDTPAWEPMLGVLVPFNQTWAKDASALLIACSDTMMQSSLEAEPKPSRTHSFDAGAAWMQLALQATRIGLYTHGMSGVDFDAARRVLEVPERFHVECAIAIGRIGDPATLPDQLREREGPSDRKPAESFISEGRFAA